MKRKVLTIVAVTMLIGALSSLAKAQSTGCARLVADIPFAFTVGNKSLPAGTYQVKCLRPATDLKVLQLNNTNGRSKILIQTHAVQGSGRDAARLVFNRYGNRYFFSQVWLPGEQMGLEAPRSRVEQLAVRELAESKPITMRVALRRER